MSGEEQECDGEEHVCNWGRNSGSAPFNLRHPMFGRENSVYKVKELVSVQVRQGWFFHTGTSSYICGGKLWANIIRSGRSSLRYGA